MSERPRICPVCRGNAVRKRDEFEREFMFALGKPLSATGECEGCGWLGLYDCCEEEGLKMTNLRRDRPI